VLLCAFVVLLTAAVVKRVDTVSDRVAADRAPSARCPAHERPRRARPGFRLCAVVGGTARERPRVRRRYSSRTVE
jgi:hypothetical protein